MELGFLSEFWVILSIFNPFTVIQSTICYVKMLNSFNLHNVQNIFIIDVIMQFSYRKLFNFPSCEVEKKVRQNNSTGMIYRIRTVAIITATGGLNDSSRATTTVSGGDRFRSRAQHSCVWLPLDQYVRTRRGRLSPVRCAPIHLSRYSV